MLISTIITTHAVNFSDFNNAGGVWRYEYSGYRFTIVDENFNKVSNTVDITFADPLDFSGKKVAYQWYYINSRANRGLNSLSEGGEGYDKVLYDVISHEISGMPQPLSKSGSQYQAHGQGFKDWFFKKSTSAGGGGSITEKTIETNDGLNVIDNNVSDVGALNLPDTSYLSEFLANTNLDSELENLKNTLVGMYGEDGFNSIKNKGNSDKEVIQMDINMDWMWYVSTYGEENNNENNKTYVKLTTLLASYDMLMNKSDTQAEANYRFIRALKNLNMAKGSGGKNSASIDEIKDTMYVFSGTDLLNQIPLDDGDEDYDPSTHGYYKSLINHKLANGGYMFKLDGTGDDKTVLQVMGINNYSIIVEPLFWAPINNLNWMYGTVANIADFSIHFDKLKGNAGPYIVFTGKLMWRGFTVGNDWGDKLKAANTSDGQTIEGTANWCYWQAFLEKFWQIIFLNFF